MSSTPVGDSIPLVFLSHDLAKYNYIFLKVNIIQLFLH